MKYNWFENAHHFAKLVITLSLMLVCVFTAFILSAFIAAPFFHKGIIDLLNSASDIRNPSNIYLLKYFQVVQSITFFIVPPFILAVLFGYKPADYLYLKKTPAITLIFIIICLVFAAIPFINFLEDVNSRMKLPGFFSGIEHWMKSNEENAGILSENFLKVTTLGGLFFNLFMMALLPALGEEFIFRGVFQRLFSEWSKNHHAGIILSAALFSAIHFQFYGFIPRLLLGISFGYLLIWSGSMWIPVLAHFINNSIGVIYYFLFNKGLVSDSLDKIGTLHQGYYYAIVSFLISISLIYFFFKSAKVKMENSNMKI